MKDKFKIYFYICTLVFILGQTLVVEPAIILPHPTRK